MDVHDKKARIYNMSKIKSKGTKLENDVSKYLFSKGFRYLKNDKRLPGKPDIVLPKYMTVIFVNGCLWHGHKGCKYFTWPKTNSDYWIEKINNNRKRDIANEERLKALGWDVLTVWGCQLKPKCRDKTLEELTKTLHASKRQN